ncbi:MAG: hypothetical protein AB7I09_20480 [Planctomycetota bacterium]
MNDISDLEAGLKRLHLPTIRRMHAQLQSEAEKESWTNRDFLAKLVNEGARASR